VSELEDLIGGTVGNFRILRRLGVGGMGAVYLAEHPQIQSKVAIKVLLPRFNTDEGIVKRFLDEARAVNRIGHQGIVRIHDCNKQDGVGLFLVMEYLEGETLKDRLKREKPLAWDIAVRFLQQAASALVASHDTKIIHRDLKPANIFLVPDADLPGGERVKILDFGIAKLVEDVEPMDGGTKTGMLLGSPLYMSPEQCIDAKSVDHRTDIYSLGAIGYLLITGEFPFQADTIGRLIIAHQTSKPRKPRELRPEVPEAVEAVLLCSLDVDPEKRFQTMKEFRDALRGLLAPGAHTTGVTDVPAAAAHPEGGQPAAMVDSHAGATGPGLARAGAASAAAVSVTTLSGSSGERSEVAPSVAAKPFPALKVGVGAAILAAVVLVVLFVGPFGGGSDRNAGSARSTAAAPADPGTPSTKSAPAAPAAPEPRAPAPAIVEKKAEEKEATLPPLKVVLELTPENARATLDGKPVEGKTLELAQNGQKLHLLVEAAGYAPQEQIIVADQSQAPVVKVSLRPHGGAGGVVAKGKAKAGSPTTPQGAAEPKAKGGKGKGKAAPDEKGKREGPYFNDL
jgi:eukaryotic-like serine/threonine-protein kinase